jgi:predicted acylesterase/phospholipase RssA
MGKPIQLQLAFQGGGAKLALLIAAAEAISEMEDAGEIKITRIAGTSAGAIIGALLAAKCDIAKVRAELAGAKGRDFLKHYQLPSFTTGLWSAIRGKPFWSEEPLRDWLVDQFAAFSARAGHPFTFDDLPRLNRPRLVVVATNLSTGRRHEASGTSDVVGALLSSAGLPFCFRMWKTGGQEVLVDGGLCKNLPVETLLQSQDTDGRVIAFTFNQPRPARLTSLKDFMMALLDTAINDSVQSAQNVLGEDGVYVLDRESTQVTTLDFNAALAFLADLSAYSETKTAVKTWIKNLVTRDLKESLLRNDGVIMQDLWRRPVSDEAYRMMEAVGRMYHLTYSAQRFRYHRMRVTVTANCLSQPHEPGYGAPDIIDYLLEFEPIDHPVAAHRLLLSNTRKQQYIADYAVSLRCPVAQDSRMEVFGATVPTSPHLRALVAFFLPALEPKTGVYALTLKDKAVNSFVDLDTQGRDRIGLELKRAAGMIGVVEIVLKVPRSFRPVRLGPSNVTNFTIMDSEEQKQMLGHLDPDYTTWSWARKNLPELERIDVELLA